MKPILIPLFPVVFLFLGGCRKSGGGNHAVITNPTSYILKKRTMLTSNNSGESAGFFYNSQHLITQIRTIHWVTGAIYGQPTRTWYDTANYQFEYTNGLVSRSTWTSAGSRAYYTYDYNGANLLTRRTFYQAYITRDPVTGTDKPDTLKRYNLYSYDNNRNLVEVTDSTTKTHFRHEFTYEGNGNLASETIYELDYRPNTKFKYEWSAYDNKVNFVKAINGLPVIYPWDNTFHAYSNSSSGNFGVEKDYSAASVNQPFTNPVSYPCSYEYNEDGLPTKMTWGKSVVTFEYQKFRL